MASTELKLYRKRIIPEECILLKDDVILHADERIIVTAWKTIRPKEAFDHGYSCYFLEEGCKVSRFLRPDNTLLYWYCDIVDHTFDPGENAYVFRDLLADVIVYPNGFVKVVDLDEFELALEQGSLTIEDVRRSIRSLSALLKVIYNHEFDRMTDEIMKRIPE